MRETWYVLEDGTAVDPSEVTTDKSGRLVHKDGVVQMRSADTPMTRGVDVAARRGKTKSGEAKDSKPEPDKGGGYKTRESKAD